MTEPTQPMDLPLDVAGPVQAEVFVVWLNGEQLELTGPCGAAPWIIELESGAAAVHVVVPMRMPIARRTRRIVGGPMLAVGIGLASGAVASAGDAEVEREDALMTRGAYALSRNPMYVGWSAGVLGLASWNPLRVVAGGVDRGRARSRSRDRHRGVTARRPLRLHRRGLSRTRAALSPPSGAGWIRTWIPVLTFPAR